MDLLTIQNALGSVTGFPASAQWTASINAAYNAALTAAGATGNIGGRCFVEFAGDRWNIQEGNIQGPPIVPTNFRDWRVWLYRYADASVKMLAVRTHGGSVSFGNPSAVIVPSPKDGQACMCVTYFVFGEGAGPGEAGSLLFFTPLTSTTSN